MATNNHNDLFNAVATAWVERAAGKSDHVENANFKQMVKHFLYAYNNKASNADHHPNNSFLMTDMHCNGTLPKDFVDANQITDYDSLLRFAKKTYANVDPYNQSSVDGFFHLTVFIGYMIRKMTYIQADFFMKASGKSNPALIQLGKNCEPISREHIDIYLDYIELKTGFSLLAIEDDEYGSTQPLSTRTLHPNRDARNRPLVLLYIAPNHQNYGCITLPDSHRNFTIDQARAELFTQADRVKILFRQGVEDVLRTNTSNSEAYLFSLLAQELKGHADKFNDICRNITNCVEQISLLPSARTEPERNLLSALAKNPFVNAGMEHYLQWDMNTLTAFRHYASITAPVTNAPRAPIPLRRMRDAGLLEGHSSTGLVDVSRPLAEQGLSGQPHGLYYNQGNTRDRSNSNEAHRGSPTPGEQSRLFFDAFESIITLYAGSDYFTMEKFQFVEKLGALLQTAKGKVGLEQKKDQELIRQNLLAGGAELQTLISTRPDLKEALDLGSSSSSSQSAGAPPRA
jgi:hypothetical protein